MSDHGKVVHFEIPAEDVERAEKFYADNFGWKMNKMGAEYGDYIVVHTGPMAENNMPAESGFINGGIMKRGRPGQQPDIVIAVDNTDEALKKIEATGGKVTQGAMDIPGIGRYALIEDPEGNIIAILQPVNM